MGVTLKDFETFEQQFIDLIGEYQCVTASEKHLREVLRNEAARAEKAESAKDAAERGAADARAAAAAATAGAVQAAATLAATQEDLVAVKMQLEFSENQRTIFEEKCTDMSKKINSLEQELKPLQSLQSSYSILQKQYTELQERIQHSTEEARSEASRLETELRRVETCASAGAELRERARLAAAAHDRERRFAAAEHRHTVHELQRANAEIARLNMKLAELQFKSNEQSVMKIEDPERQALIEARSALEVERAGTAKFEQALAAALADNATLASQLHTKDNRLMEENISSQDYKSTSICPIDQFLAE